MATVTSETEYNVLRFWKDTISQFQFLYDIQQRNVSDHSNVILTLMGRRMASGETFSLTLPIGPANFSLIWENRYCGCRVQRVVIQEAIISC